MLELFQSRGKVPKNVLSFQGIMILMILIYGLLLMGNGTVSIFAGWIGALAGSGAAAGLSFFKKRLVIGSVDLAVFILVFLHLFLLPV